MLDIDSAKKVILDNSNEVDGKMKLSCGKAFKISEDLSISLAQVGDICNQLEVKISSCQLGCFK